MNNMYEKRNSLLKSALKSLGNSAKLCKKYSGDNLDENVEELQKIAMNYSKLDLEFDHFKTNIKNTEKFFKDNEDRTDLTLEEKFNEISEENPLVVEEDSLTTHPIMEGFLSNLEEFEMDEFEKSEEEFIPPTDPITKQPIQNPVKNPQCGHIYESDSIKELISVRKNTRCPYIGCPALQYIKIAQLTEDTELKRKIDFYNFNH